LSRSSNELRRKVKLGGQKVYKEIEAGKYKKLGSEEFLKEIEKW